MPFNLDRLEVAGGPVSIVEGVSRNNRGPFLQYAFSASGTLAYIPGTSRAAASTQRTLVWVDRSGKEEPLAAAPNAYGSPRISPDGTRVALAVGSTPTHWDIWIWDRGRKVLTRLTFGPSGFTVPLWTPDGKRIAFSSGSGRDQWDQHVYWQAADGTGKIEPLVTTQSPAIIASSWSSDGKTLVGMQPDRDTTGAFKSNIGALSMESDHKFKPLLKETYDEFQPRLSPNGRWMAYVNESGKNEVYARPFPEVDGGRWQISTSGGDSPLWSRDGRELFYRNGDAVMAVPVKTDPSFSLEVPKTLFRGTYVAFSSIGFDPELNPWDIHPDGKRFLMMKQSESTAGGGPRKINIVLNWLEELKQRVPTGKK